MQDTGCWCEAIDMHMPWLSPEKSRVAFWPHPFIYATYIPSSKVCRQEKKITAGKKAEENMGKKERSCVHLVNFHIFFGE